MKLTVGIAALLLTAVTGSAAYAQQSPTPNVQAVTPSDDVPLTDHAWHDVDVLHKAGIVIGYPDGTHSGKQNMTRHEFAVGTARLLPILLSRSSGSPGNMGALHDDLDNKLKHHPEALAAFDALLTEFQPEVESLMDGYKISIAPRGQAVAMAQARLVTLRADAQTALTAANAHAQQASAPTAQDNQQSNAIAGNRMQRHQLGEGGQARRVVVHVMRYLPFTDVPKDHWAYQSVETLRKAGIMLGYPVPHPTSRFTRAIHLENIRQSKPTGTPAGK